ncbi:MAG: hypothetical protein L0219_06755 [Phycisphaerales bacterium]|nr:hypothetical protein [Phycisphaerales bacterium]
MVPCPVAIGLTICDYVIVEERTKKISTIGSFSGMKVPRFPHLPPPVSVFAWLTDGHGVGLAQVAVKSLAYDTDIYSEFLEVKLPDRLTEVPISHRIWSCVFHSGGLYEVSLSVDGERLASRRLRVYAAETPS